MSSYPLDGHQNILVHQVHELGEWVGFETRNKYQLLDESKNPIGYAAEQQKGFFGFLLRQFLGHWRRFDIHFFTPDRQLAYLAHHPFRWLFRRIEIRTPSGEPLGAVQQRFSLLSKRFDVENSQGMVVMEVSSPIWKLWTFEFMSGNKAVAYVRKKWSGLMMEAFTDKDNFLVEFSSPDLTNEEKNLVMASAVFIDLLYFEVKKS